MLVGGPVVLVEGVVPGVLVGGPVVLVVVGVEPGGWLVGAVVVTVLSVILMVQTLRQGI